MFSVDRRELKEEWGKGECLDSLISLKKPIPKYGVANELKKLFKGKVAMPIAAQQQQQQKTRDEIEEENELDLLFDDNNEAETTKKRLRELPVAAVVDQKESCVEQASKSVDKKIKMAPFNQTQKKGQVNANVKEWMDDWLARGKSGSIGLVPQPFQSFFPSDYKKVALTERDESLLSHFDQWLKFK